MTRRPQPQIILPPEPCPFDLLVQPFQRGWCQRPDLLLQCPSGNVANAVTSLAVSRSMGSTLGTVGAACRRSSAVARRPGLGGATPPDETQVMPYSHLTKRRRPAQRT